MATALKKAPTSKTDPKHDRTLDLQGSKQHHDLKNQAGEAGNPNHATNAKGQSEDLVQLVEDAAKETGKDTQVASELKKAVK